MADAEGYGSESVAFRNYTCVSEAMIRFRTMCSYVGKLRTRIAKHPVISVTVAALTSFGTAYHFVKDILDWVSRWDTWNAHSAKAIAAAAVMAQFLPVWAPEACYIIALLLIAVVALRRDNPSADRTVSEITEKQELSNSMRDDVEFRPSRNPARSALDILRLSMDERRASALLVRSRELEVEERQKRLRALDNSNSSFTESTDSPPSRNMLSQAAPNLRPGMPWIEFVRLDQWKRPIGDSNGPYVALMAPFRNDATKDHPRVSEADDLVATIRPGSIPEFVITGYWLNSDYRSVSLEPGGRQVLVLAIVSRHKTGVRAWELCAWFLNDVRDDEQELHVLDHQLFWVAPTTVDDVTVSISLSNGGVFMGEYFFKLTLQPVHGINLVQEAF